MARTAGASNPHVTSWTPTSSQVEKSTTRTLSRWRHGFEPRWDYKRKAPGQGVSPESIRSLNRDSNAGYPANIPHRIERSERPKGRARRGWMHSPPLRLQCGIRLWKVLRSRRARSQPSGRGEFLAALFAALLGAMSITAEIRHGTIRATFLITPRRGRVVTAKVLVSILIGSGFGLVAGAVATAAGTAALRARGIDLQLDRAKRVGPGRSRAPSCAGSSRGSPGSRRTARLPTPRTDPCPLRHVRYCRRGIGDGLNPLTMR